MTESRWDSLRAMSPSPFAVFRRQHRHDHQRLETLLAFKTLAQHAFDDEAFGFVKRAGAMVLFFDIEPEPVRATLREREAFHQSHRRPAETAALPGDHD